MNIYLLSQDENTGYDTYSDCVVIASSEDQARHIHPRHGLDWKPGSHFWTDCEWVSNPESVDVQLLGVASDDQSVAGVICASYHAG